MSSITMKNKKGTVIHRTTSETLRLGDDISTNHNQVRVSVQSISRKKSQTTSPSCSFQITGVSLTRYDLGDDSADDLDESHTDDISRITDNETPSFSEDSRDTDDPQQFIYNVATSVPNQNQSTLAKVENDPKIIENENRNSSIGRFKVVKIESVVPFSRGRWTCFDYLDQTDGSSKPSYVFCTRSQFGSDQSQLGEDEKPRTCIDASFLDNNEAGDKKRVPNNSAFFETNCQEPYLYSGAIIIPEGAPLYPAPLNRPPRNKTRSSCPTTPNFLPICRPIRSTRPFLTTSSSFYSVRTTPDIQSGVIINNPAKTIIKTEPTELVQQDSNKYARASVSCTATIDTKIEHALDVVKNHLTHAVRLEVEELKIKINELVDRISYLEYENDLLRANVAPDVLANLENNVAK